MYNEGRRFKRRWCIVCTWLQTPKLQVWLNDPIKSIPSTLLHWGGIHKLTQGIPAAKPLVFTVQKQTRPKENHDYRLPEAKKDTSKSRRMWPKWQAKKMGERRKKGEELMHARLHQSHDSCVQKDVGCMCGDTIRPTSNMKKLPLTKYVYSIRT